MPSVLDRYVVATYLKYYVLFVLVLSPSLVPVLLRLSTSAAYLPPMLSIVGSGALCATLLELGYRREMTTLQRYGVGYGQMLRPLLGTALALLATVSTVAVLISAVRGPAVYWSIAGLFAVILCAFVAFRGTWTKREAGTGTACFRGFACHFAILGLALIPMTTHW